MENVKKMISAPNLLNICIDNREDGECSGRIWYLYGGQPVLFFNTVDLLKKMDGFFDSLNYPQASTTSRTFYMEDKIRKPEEKKEAVAQMAVQELLEKKGDEATFIIHVKYRQNATWQGEVIWADKKKKKCFRSALELLKMIDSAMEQGTIGAEESSESKEKGRSCDESCEQTIL